MFYAIIGQGVVMLACGAILAIPVFGSIMVFDHWLGLFRLNWFDRRAGGTPRVSPFSITGVRIAFRGAVRNTKYKGTDKLGNWTWSIPGQFSDKRIKRLERHYY
jgi:hypothetical protein